MLTVWIIQKYRIQIVETISILLNGWRHGNKNIGLPTGSEVGTCPIHGNNALTDCYFDQYNNKIKLLIAFFFQFYWQPSVYL